MFLSNNYDIIQHSITIYGETYSVSDLFDVVVGVIVEASIALATRISRMESGFESQPPSAALSYLLSFPIECNMSQFLFVTKPGGHGVGSPTYRSASLGITCKVKMNYEPHIASMGHYFLPYYILKSVEVSCFVLRPPS